MALTPKTAFLSGNEDGTPLTGGSGTYGPISLTTIARLLNSLSVLQSITDTAPPGSATAGMAYYVAATATGAWAGQDGKIALRTDTGWEFYDPVAGIAYGNATTGQIYKYDGSAMVAVGGSGGGGGGTVSVNAPLTGDGSVGTPIEVDVDALLDSVTAATTAEITALNADDPLLIKTASGWRRVNADDMPGGAAASVDLVGRKASKLVIKTAFEAPASGNNVLFLPGSSFGLDNSKAHLVYVGALQGSRYNYAFASVDNLLNASGQQYAGSSLTGGRWYEFAAGQAFEVRIAAVDPGRSPIAVEIWEKA